MLYVLPNHLYRGTVRTCYLTPQRHLGRRRRSGSKSSEDKRNLTEFFPPGVACGSAYQLPTAPCPLGSRLQIFEQGAGISTCRHIDAPRVCLDAEDIAFFSLNTSVAECNSYSRKSFLLFLRTRILLI